MSQDIQHQVSDNSHDHHVIHAGWMHTLIGALCICLALTTGLSVYFALQLNQRVNSSNGSATKTSAARSDQGSASNTPDQMDLSSTSKAQTVEAKELTPLYYAGSVGQDKIRLILNYYGGNDQKADFAGLAVYENQSLYPLQIRGYFETTSQDECLKYCQFSFVESDGELQTTEFSGNSDQKLNDLTGTRIKSGQTSLKFELKRVEAFNYNDFLKKV
jgi:hypothetical protein